MTAQKPRLQVLTGPRPAFSLDSRVITGRAGIKALRELKGWDVESAGNALGVSPRTVRGYEADRPVPDSVMRLAWYTLKYGTIEEIEARERGEP